METVKKYRWYLIGGAVILIIGLLALSRSQTNEANAAEQTGDTAVAFIGNLSESATASGQVEAQQEVTLAMSSSGVVSQVDVAVGDMVNSGDVLVKLDSAALERAVRSAEADVAIAEANLANLLAEPTAEELASAEAVVASAQAKLDDLLDGPGEEEIAASEASVQSARANIWSASGNYVANNEVSEADILAAEAELEAVLEQKESADAIWIRLADCEVNENGTHTCTAGNSDRMEAATENVALANAQVALAEARLAELRNPTSSSIASASAGIASASAQYDAAVARHNALLAGATEAEIAAAEADLASAQASLAKLVDGPLDTDITIYEARLAQAQTALREAQNGLDDATLLAPFDGVVTAVQVSVGEQVSGPVVEIVNNSSLEVILNVDEIDVGRLAVGQEAIVTLETWPDVEIASAVTAIAPSATINNTDIVSYDVHLSLLETDLPILVGMTANADLITANRKGVLLVPNAALTADRENGTYSVNLVSKDAEGNMTTTTVAVTIGLKDSQFTQITGGLIEGDEVLIGELLAPVGNGGFGPPGGPRQ